MIKRHETNKENKGGIISKESFIHQSNIKILMKKKRRKSRVTIMARLKITYEKDNK